MSIEVICTLCEGEDAKVPFEMMLAHVALIHPDIDAAITNETITMIELKCAYSHILEAYEKLDRADYPTGHAYRTVMASMEKVGGNLRALIDMVMGCER